MLLVTCDVCSGAKKAAPEGSSVEGGGQSDLQWGAGLMRPNLLLPHQNQKLNPRRVTLCTYVNFSGAAVLRQKPQTAGFISRRALAKRRTGSPGEAFDTGNLNHN